MQLQIGKMSEIQNRSFRFADWRKARRQNSGAPKAEGKNQMDMSKYIGNVFLKVDDLKASGPTRVTIIDVSEGRYGKPNLTFDDGTQLSLNATNVRVLVKTFGKESDNLIDKEVELVVGEVEFEGKPQEAVLIKPISSATKASPKPDLNDEIPF